jgi:hypothetical protein
MKTKIEIERFLKKYCNKSDKIIIENLNLSEINLNDLQKDFSIIEQCQKKLLQSLLSTSSLNSILEEFGIHKNVIPYARELINMPHLSLPMLRLDLIPDGLGSAKICEINVGPSLGGIENFQLYRISQNENNMIEYLDPYRHLSILIANEIKKSNLEKIVIADFEDFMKTSTYNLEWLKLSLEYWLPGIEVQICTEKNILQKINKKTLVFRIFTSADIIENMDFYKNIENLCGRLLYDFSCEFFASKKWLSLLWEGYYSNIFSNYEKEAIAKWIPKTTNVNSTNLEEILEYKDLYYFKKFVSYGGKDVRSGADSSKDELRVWLNQNQQKGCIAQEIINKVQYCNTRDKTSKKNLVLGVYRINNSWSGCFVRTHPSNKVINVSSGGYGGWGYVSI